MPRIFVAICVRCGCQAHATTAVEDGWILLPSPKHGYLVNAFCWRCDRDQRAAEMGAA